MQVPRSRREELCDSFDYLRLPLIGEDGLEATAPCSEGRIFLAEADSDVQTRHHLAAVY